MGSFVPGWAYTWLLVAAGAAWILGAQRFAAVLAIPVLLHWFISPLVTPLYGALPLYFQLLVAVVGCLLLLHGIVRLVFGEEAAGQLTGTLLVRLLDAAVLWPFWLLRALARLIRYRGQ